MKDLFIDESTKQKNRNNKHFFIQIGSTVNKEEIISLEANLRDIKQKLEERGTE